MDKSRKKHAKVIPLILLIFLSPIIVVVLLLGIGFAALSIWGEVQHYQIRNEIISYVQENFQSLVLTSPDSHQEFFYTATGFQDGGIEYGYYYSPDDDHIFQGEPYRKGNRTYGIPDDPTDWYYSERICENWFYYEVHDG